MMNALRPALALVLVCTALLGVVYPLAITGVSKLLFPAAANGSLIIMDGKVTGSELLGQAFTKPGYFWGRPSATAPAYNAAASSGSNLSPGNPALQEAVKQRIAALRKADPDNKAAIPVDLVTASASGLDPHISPQAAYYQVARVAKARKIKQEHVTALVDARVEGRSFGLLGEERVNVLLLNMDLDRQVSALKEKR